MLQAPRSHLRQHCSQVGSRIIVCGSAHIDASCCRIQEGKSQLYSTALAGDELRRSGRLRSCILWRLCDCHQVHSIYANSLAYTASGNKQILSRLLRQPVQKQTFLWFTASGRGVQDLRALLSLLYTGQLLHTCFCGRGKLVSWHLSLALAGSVETHLLLWQGYAHESACG